jgi:predicted amidohydrolase YtcJ
VNTTSLNSIRQTARLAIQHDFQLCVHAIGDRANRETLDVFEEAFQSNPEKSDLRWRIEHAQHLHPRDIPRFAELGVIASMQAIHCTSDAPFVVDRLGTQRARQGAYAWRSLIDAGAVVSNGTDTPVEHINPIDGFHAAVTRRPVGREPFFPEQRMTRQEALRSYTLNAAHAAFEDNLKGSVTPGKLADIVVLSHDILTVPEAEILDARVMYTIIGGKVRYERGEP